MNTRHILIAALLAGLAATPLAQAAEGRPNVIVMMLDDMGFSDLGCYGGEIQTPNLDTLASQGVRFTQFRNAGRCCPTRGSILTGLYPHQAGLQGMEGPEENDTAFFQYRGSLHENCVTIAEVLKPLGYRTYSVGKWHVGFPGNGASPIQRGFDHWVGVYEGWSDYDEKVVEKGMLVEDDVVVTEIPEGFVEDERNITGYYTDRAIEYATADPSTPFFIYFPHIAPHFNLGPLPKNVEKYEGVYEVGYDVLREQRFARQKEMGLFPEDMVMGERYWRTPPFAEADGKTANHRNMMRYAACVDEVDQGVGKLVAALKETGQWENTVFLFLSDNGYVAQSGWGELGNTPFRYYKQQLFEGGTATPLIAVWPGRFPEGVINTVQPGHVKDIMATIIEITGATYPTEFKGKPVFPLEGKSLLHAMKDPESYRDPGVVGWEHQGHRAVIDGDWKLVSLYKADPPGTELPKKNMRLGAILSQSRGERTGRWELYNLRTDRAENNDLADEMPEKVAELERKYFEWAERTQSMEREELNELWGLNE